MAENFDVTGRLAEGQPAVDSVQEFVWACHLLGYQNPDLTAHAAQIREWYASEDGLNLRALDADSVALERAAAATQEALARQDEQLTALSAAWEGSGADASVEFLRRHGEASRNAADAVRSAADALGALRDELWRAVDAKAAAATAIDDRTHAQRAEWLAAAQTVMTGAGDRATASEMVDQQVKPFVDNTIRGEWLAAMRSTQAAVDDAYDAVTAELAAQPDAVFAVPGGLGPSWVPPPSESAATTTAAATTPAAAPAPAVSPSAGGPPAWSAPPTWSAPPAAPPMPVAPAAAPVAPAAAPPIEPALEPARAAAAPAMAAPPSLGGMPDIGSGLSGFAQQLGDMLGGLLGTAEDALPDPAGIDEPPELDELNSRDDDADELDDVAEDDSEVGSELESADATEPDTATDASCAPPVEEPPVAPVEPLSDESPEITEPEPTPVPESPPVPPPPPEPVPPPAPETATGTPCEIAADELPQVGE